MSFWKGNYIILTMKKSKAALFVFLGTIVFSYSLLRFTPFPELKKIREQQYSSRFYDKDSNLIFIMPLEDGLYREYYKIDDIPENVVNTFINSEDKRFYYHPGVNPFAIARAFIQNKKENRTVSGASTITMQLARILVPRKNRNVSIKQKIKESINALRIETRLSKKEILELYLNNIPFGNQIEGIGSASRFFYSCTPKQLSQAQTLCLATIPRRPAYYSPAVDEKNSYSQAMVLAHELKFNCSIDEWVKLVRPKKNHFTNRHIHFVKAIINQHARHNKIVPYEVNTFIDSKLNDLITDNINSKIQTAENSRIKNGGAIVIENKTGNIIAWIGNTSFDNEDSGQIDSVLAMHQTGSSTKPFLYALALERNLSPNSVLSDIPKDYGGEKVYVPLNFNNQYNGPVSLRVALASSLNIPAVDTLFKTGIDEYYSFLLSSLDFQSLMNSRSTSGLSIALGSGEMSLLELARGFTVFANDGILTSVVATKEDKDLFSDLFSQNKTFSKKRVMERDTARIICDILSDRKSQTLGFRRSKYVFGTNYPCLFKTGTANQYQDILALASTSHYTCAVWMGNLDGETVIGKTGSSLPAMVARTALDYITQNGANTSVCTEFKECETYEKRKLCRLSQMEPGESCPSTSYEYVRKNAFVPQCSWHYRHGNTDLLRLPSEYQHWFSNKNFKNSGNTFSNEELDILYPTNGATFIYDPGIQEENQKLRIQACGGKVDYCILYHDGKFVSKAENRFIWHVKLEKGNHIITIRCGNEEKTISYSVN